MPNAAVPGLASLTPAILAVRNRLAPYIRVTPCEASLPLSERFGADVWLKGEHLQHTGSFKARGALHKLLCLTDEERAAGVVTASSGNHGAGVAWASRTLGVQALVFMPEGASTTKVARIRRYGADVESYGSDGLDTELHARTYAAELGRAYISPYNDLEVVAGQGTVGVEILEQMQGVDNVIVAVGGGGLIGGIAAYLKSQLPNVRIIGALPEKSPVMALSVRAGHIVEFPSEPTLSDGTAGGVEPDSVTFELCRALVDDWVLVSETEIAATMRAFIAEHSQLIEGSAAVALAALGRKDFRGQRVAVVLCGGNVSVDTLRQVLSSPT
ncbi:MAG: threonine/serine dehydratase [Gemmatimonadaceae bacterium]